jgi:hypothetical protein
MIQWILTILVLSLAVWYITYKLAIKPGRSKPTMPADCNSCNSDCSKCPAINNTDRIFQSIELKNSDKKT